MRVVVIVVNYNAGAFLRPCLDALSRQTRTPERTVVVDNASTDGGIEGLMGDFPGVEWLPLSRNTGFAAANNIALSLVGDCDRVALLNPDTIPEPGWLQALLEAVPRHRDGDIFGCCMLGYGDDEPVDGTGDVYHVSGLYWRRDNGVPANLCASGEDEIFAPCAAAALYAYKPMMDVGGFDEDYFCYSEDIDLGFRLRARGARAYYIPAAVVRHAGSATTGRRSDFSVYYGHRNLVTTFVKNMPGIYLWIYLPQHLLLNLVSILHFIRRGQGRVILRAKRDALRSIPSTWRKRRVAGYLRLAEPRALIAVMKKGLLTPYVGRHD
jgi:GT2 family glycosyltransferase